ncbi:MAG: hypothetical protein ABEI06_01630 [Halobacteriaceae archaeon]
MLYCNLSDFMIEIKNGSIQNVGPSNKTGEIKLYDIDEITVREFGDEQVKLVCEDEDSNEVHLALFPDQMEEIIDQANTLKDEGAVFE